jgi:cytochrome c
MGPLVHWLFVFAGTILLTAQAVAQDVTCRSPAPIPLTGASCAPLNAPEIGCRLWQDVEGGLGQANLNTVQRAADLFSWQTFLALNAPAGAERGEPNPTRPYAESGRRVWESWKEAFEVYLPDGAEPAPWATPEPIPEACRGGNPTRTLRRSAKVSDVVDLVLQAVAADGTLPATLKDQDGRLVRYEIRLNRPLFDYIADPRSALYSGLALYNGREQGKAREIDFPVGSQLIKAAWRPVGAAEEPFLHVTEACVCDEVGVDTPSSCRLETMGLAGFHIMTKTPSAPSWIWSTFEQVDNVTSTHGAVASLNDPSCPPSLCPPNRQTAISLPTQVRRTIPIPDQDPDCAKPHQAADNIAQLNTDVQKALGAIGSAFSNYNLIGTQWPLPTTENLPPTVFAAVPALLGNTTLETFAQNTSSCMGCHSISRTLSPERFVSADFSFTLNNAQPRPRGAWCENVEASESCSDSILPPPRAPQTTWDVENWSEILAGYAYATQTYELTNPRYVESRLHCSSCHLDAGGNRSAAWWVGMWQAYDYPATTGLQDRINGCFERSMNGAPVCDTTGGAADCAKSPIMRSLITYMKWLDEQFAARYPRRTPCRGYPPYNPEPGDVGRGRAVFVQKCSFCHNAQGQGRYESDTYFRPALWGPDSFNACAGMASTDYLSTFVRWNMPLTSGGLLTNHEADDVAAYIAAQCRPGKGGVGPDGEPCPLSADCSEGAQVKSHTTPARILSIQQEPDVPSCPAPGTEP